MKTSDRIERFGATCRCARCFPAAAALSVIVTVVLLGLLCGADAAVAAFTRSPLASITASGSGQLSRPGGVAVDGSDNLWLGDGRAPSITLDQFGPAYAVPESQPIASLTTVAETGPASLAVEQSTGDVFLTGDISESEESNNPRVEVFKSNGELLTQWLKFGESAHVAIDNSTSPLDSAACKLSECTVYVAHTGTNPEAPRGDEEASGIEKFEADALGEPHAAPFTATASYIENNEIVGTPVGAEGCESARFTPEGKANIHDIAVDSEGNIYAVDSECRHETPAVLEYRPSGEFVRAITGVGTTGLKGTGNGGWGGGEGIALSLTGVAIDSASNHLLVSLDITFNGEEKLGAVDEFDLASDSFIAQTTEAGEGRSLEEPVAVASDSHDDLYVVDRRKEAVEVYGPGRRLPNLRISQASGLTRTSSVVSGAVDPEALSVSSCEFQYVPDAVFTRNVEEHEGKDSAGFASLAEGGEVPCTPAAAGIAPDREFHAVQAQIGGLSSGTLYRYRLVVTNEEPAGGTAVTGALGFTAQSAPEVLGESARNVSSGFADLLAEIQILGAPTSYHFEYDTTPYVGASEHGVSIPVPAAAIGAGGVTGSAVAKVTEDLAGLSPDTVYHFRVVAESLIEGKAERVYGEDASFTTTSTRIQGLPDGRAYELVTPAYKGSAEDMFANDRSAGLEPGTKDRGYAAESGDQFLLETRAAFGPFPGSGRSAYVFSRAQAGWAYNSLASPHLGLQAFETPAFAPEDMSQVALVDLTGAGASVGGRRAVGLEGPPGGEYRLLYEGQPTHGGLQDAEHTKIVSSQDFSRLVIDSGNHALCPGAESQDEGSHTLCEVEPGELKLADVDSAGQPVSQCGAQLGRDTMVLSAAHNAVSDDRMFFTAPDPEMHGDGTAATAGCWNRETGEDPPQIYMRFGAMTLDVSTPLPNVLEGGGAPVMQPAAYIGASVDGSKMFFISREELTKGDEGIHDPELYEWEAEGSGSCDATSGNYNQASRGCLSRISSGESGHAVASLRAVRAISADGAAVYFTSSSQLTANAPAVGEEFGSSELNVYRYDSVAKTTTYVATVLEVEEPDENAADWLEPLVELTGGRNFAPESATGWYTTPDGSYLMFPTTRELTGYHTHGCQAVVLPDTQGSNDGHCEELYRYSFGASAGEALTCVSCNPSGAAAVGHAQSERSFPIESPTAGAVLSLSSDGSLAFFDTRDALVPQDSNGTLDVYEWERDGAHGCALASGCVHLISSGEDSQPSFYLGASPDGDNVFFGTHARLVASDTDGAGDLYDARICTTTDPCVQSTVGQSTQCEGDACQTAPVAPQDTTPGSLTLFGNSNFPAEAPRVAAKPPTAAQLRARKLAKALKTCRKRRSQARRRACEKASRKKYGPVKKVAPGKRAK